MASRTIPSLAINGLDTRVILANGVSYRFRDFEESGVSYIPCTQYINKNGALIEHPIFKYEKIYLDDERKQITLDYFKSKPSSHLSLKTVTGVQIFTGRSTFRDDTYLLDLDIEARMIRKYRSAVIEICHIYKRGCDREPCSINTKSNGLRLSAFAPGLGPKVSFRDKELAPGESRTSKGVMLMEFFSKEGMSRIDKRYEQRSGSLLNIPTIDIDSINAITDIISTVGERVTESDSKYIYHNSPVPTYQPRLRRTLGGR